MRDPRCEYSLDQASPASIGRDGQPYSGNLQSAAELTPNIEGREIPTSMLDVGCSVFDVRNGVLACEDSVEEPG